MRRVLGRGLGLALVAALAVALLTAGPGILPRAPSPTSPTEPSGPVAAVPASSRVAIAPGYAPAAGVTEVGPVGANTSLTVDVGLASRDPSGLAAFVNASAVPGTSAYRQFLAPAAADARFGALPAAVAAAQEYFQGFGLAASANPDGLLLSVSGPGPTVARALGTTFDVYRNSSGASFISHPSPATLPAVAPWTGALGLATDAAFVPDVRPVSAGPAATPSASCAGSAYGFTACQIATAYDYASLDAGGTNGTGETIAVIDAYSSGETQTDIASDFQHFTSDMKLPSGGLSFLYPVPTTVNLNETGTNTAWSLEDALDVEWSRAAAPGAAIEMVFSPNSGGGLYYAIDWVVAHGAANVLSMSWGEPEVGVYNPLSSPCTSACNASTDGSMAILGPILELATAEGITSFASSGDCGAADGTDGVSAQFPASEPFVTGVGATALSLLGNGSYSSETAWSGNASGTTGCDNQGGSGGGYSVLPHPWWQTGEGTVATKGRGVPDVAIVGASSSPVEIVVGGEPEGVSGTSVSSPIWAGIAATADQAAGRALGWLNPSLYAILRSSNYTSAFHEITSGTNGYPAHAGWNAVTGIGTPIVGRLVGWLVHGPLSLSSLTTAVYASPRFGSAPLTVHFALASRGGSGVFPLAGVDFGDGNASSAVLDAASHTFPSAGVYSVQSYVVDSTGNTSASAPVVVVVGGGTALSVALNASVQTPANGTNVTFTATVTGGTAPYVYNFSFGDGSSAVNLSVGSVVHDYRLAGAFCAEVVVRDTLSRPDGGASLRVPMDVGGAGTPQCGNPTEPLTVVGNASEGVRDAPADFPGLFRASGGSPAPSGLSNQTGLVSEDPYTEACGCWIFRSAGNYTVEEWVNDTVDGTASGETNVTVAAPLSATFSASTLSGVVPLTVTFSASATGGYLSSAASTRWSFGNGDSATGSSVRTTYASAGEYVAIASLSDRGFGNASEAFLIDAEATGPSAVGVTATVEPAVNVSSGATVAWNATPVGPAASLAHAVLEWDLGNGATAFGPVVNETYYAAIDLLPLDLLAGSVSVDTPQLHPLVNVGIDLPDFFATEAAGFVPATDALQLDQNVAPSSGLAPLTVNGTASASGPGGAAIGWMFGDGTSASGAAVSHVYYGAGGYTVVVKAFDPYDDLAVRVDSVVTTLPLATSGCGSASRSGTAPFTITFSPTPVGGDGPPYTFLWSLPHEGTATTANVTVAFDAGGTYTVGVVVTDPAGATTSCTWTIQVANPPAVPFLGVVLLGVVAGAGLAAFFLWATRPRRG